MAISASTARRAERSSSAFETVALRNGTPAETDTAADCPCRCAWYPAKPRLNNWNACQTTIGTAIATSSAAINLTPVKLEARRLTSQAPTTAGTSSANWPLLNTASPSSRPAAIYQVAPRPRARLSTATPQNVNASAAISPTTSRTRNGAAASMPHRTRTASSPTACEYRSLPTRYIPSAAASRNASMTTRPWVNPTCPTLNASATGTITVGPV